jgi:Zn-finger nucleic acid-binding protein
MKHCPRDREILASNELQEYRYYSCQRCSGYWIPGRAISAALSTGALSKLHALPPADAPPADCPDCRTACTPVSIDGATLDICRLCCGVWFDGGEVERLKLLFPADSAILGEEVARRAMREEQKELDVITIVLEIVWAILTFR